MNKLRKILTGFMCIALMFFVSCNAEASDKGESVNFSDINQSDLSATDGFSPDEGDDSSEGGDSFASGDDEKSGNDGDWTSVRLPEKR